MNYFDYFGLTAQFELNDAELDRVWRVLQSQVHPDRFVRAPAHEQRIAMQKATQINEAYQTLKAPLERAKYLCALHGAPISEASGEVLSPDFLMQQIEWREELEDASKDSDALEQLRKQLLVVRQQYYDQMAQAFVTITQTQAASIAVKVQEWMFVEKLIIEVNFALDRIVDNE